MHVISLAHLRAFWNKHREAETPLRAWVKLIEHSRFEGFNELRRTFPAADEVDRYVVFDIGGNKYRLIAVIHFNRQKIYVRHVLTHTEYDSGRWKTR